MTLQYVKVRKGLACELTGYRVGNSVGETVGESVGDKVGFFVGFLVGLSVGCSVGLSVGLSLGLSVYSTSKSISMRKINSAKDNREQHCSGGRKINSLERPSSSLWA